MSMILKLDREKGGNFGYNLIDVKYSMLQLHFLRNYYFCIRELINYKKKGFLTDNTFTA